MRKIIIIVCALGIAASLLMGCQAKMIDFALPEKEVLPPIPSINHEIIIRVVDEFHMDMLEGDFSSYGL
jgi:hypothetical protein